MQRSLSKKNFLLAGMVSAALAGCGGDGEEANLAASNIASTVTDITVERGPLLEATLTDANGKHATHLGNGVYRFNISPTYPISSLGGYIDLNRSGRVDTGDIKAGTLILKSGQSGLAITLGSTLASNRALLESLLVMGFTEHQLLNRTPSQDRMIAALSDELFQYAVTHHISDVATLTATDLANLSNAIQARINAYQGVATDVAVLEQQLISQLTGSVERVNTDEATALVGASPAEMLVSSLPANVLTDVQKETLAYMWNEEKLAKDVYLALNAVHPSQQLYNIATNAETQHEAAVQALLEKYNLSVSDVLNPLARYSAEDLAAIPSGRYTLPTLQSLYDTLYTKGIASAQASLEVGCMVEVTDVNDLDRDIALVANLADVKAVFENLRAGSYSHYWAFDAGLKSRGVATGCCSLGAEYCHPEYPATSNGSGGRNGGVNGGGNGAQYGRRSL